MRESTLWLLHIIAAALILVTLGVHFAVMHLDYLFRLLGLVSGNALAFESVARRSGMISYLIIYLVLLATAFYHGLYGFRSLLYELPLGPRAGKAASLIITVGGFLLFIFGAYAIILGYIQ